ncbi:MAG: tripartite tricarboxylate transporter TctB family protein [Synergistales bacterium]|nr:tripartite tricarboxylate transporter TctB family protein [Synergistales bacterium]
MHKDLTVGIAGVVISLLYSVQAMQLPKASIGNPWAPVLFPMGLGLVMLFVSVLLILKDLRRRKEGAATEAFGASKLGLAMIAGTIVLGIVYALIFEPVGFIPATLIFMGGLLLMAGGWSGWRGTLVVGFGFTFIVWYVFEKVLRIMLP